MDYKSKGLLVASADSEAMNCDIVGEVYLCWEFWDHKKGFYYEIIGQDSALYGQDDQGPIHLASRIYIKDTKITLEQALEFGTKIHEWYFGQPHDERPPFEFPSMEWEIIREIA